MTWTIKSEELLRDFKLFRLKVSTRINPRTKKAHTYFLMDGQDWVNLIALTRTGEVVLVRQFRHGSSLETIEIPGGCVEDGEQPEASARRELLEESGYEVGKVEALGSLFANPAMQGMRLHSFVAFDAVKVREPQLDEGEDIRTFTVPLATFLQMVTNGEINHALMVAAAGLLSLKYPNGLQLPGGLQLNLRE